MLVVEQTLLHHGQPRSLESINIKKLVKLAKQHDACIKVVTAIGDTVLEGTPLLHIFNAHHPFTEKELSRVLELGAARTGANGAPGQTTAMRNSAATMGSGWNKNKSPTAAAGTSR
jgi:hypothetical protein